MTAIYYVTPTDYGLSLIAQAHNAASITLVDLALGDANGTPYDPISKKGRTTLVNQRASVPLQSVINIDEHTVRVSALVDNSIGGFNVHEIGLTDQTGKLVYIGNYHGGYKPQLAQGAGGELQLYIDIKPEQGGKVLIESINPVSASQTWVLDNFVRIPTFEQHVLDNTNQHNDLQSQIINEAQSRDGKDYDLQLQIWQQQDWRTAADNWLQQQIDNEKVDRAAAILQQQIWRENAVNDLNNRKYDRSGGTISGNARMDGPLNKVNGRLIVDELRVNSLGVDQNIGLSISTQSGYTNFSNIDENGAIHQNASWFSFAGDIYCGSSAQNIVGGSGYSQGYATSITNGYMMQFGFIAYEDMANLTNSQTDEKTFDLIFPKTFSFACLTLNVSICIKNVDINNDTWAQVANVATHGATIVTQTTNSTSSRQQPFKGIFWQAIGW